MGKQNANSIIDSIHGDTQESPGFFRRAYEALGGSMNEPARFNKNLAALESAIWEQIADKKDLSSADKRDLERAVKKLMGVDASRLYKQAGGHDAINLLSSLKLESIDSEKDLVEELLSGAAAPAWTKAASSGDVRDYLVEINNRPVNGAAVYRMTPPYAVQTDPARVDLETLVWAKYAKDEVTSRARRDVLSISDVREFQRNCGLNVVYVKVLTTAYVVEAVEANTSGIERLAAQQEAELERLAPAKKKREMDYLVRRARAGKGAGMARGVGMAADEIREVAVMVKDNLAMIELFLENTDIGDAIAQGAIRAVDKKIGDVDDGEVVKAKPEKPEVSFATKAEFDQFVEAAVKAKLDEMKTKK